MARANPEIRSQLTSGATVSTSATQAGSSTTVTPWSQSVQVYNRSYQSANTPQYKTKKKRDMPWNAYNVVLTEKFPGEYRSYDLNYTSSTPPPGLGLGTGFSRQETTITGTGLRFLFEPSFGIVYDDAKGQAEASLKALLKLKSQKVNLMQVYAERGQTINMIASAASRCASAFRKLRKFDVVGAASALNVSLNSRKRRKLYRKRDRYLSEGRNGFDFASDSWLEYAFGWVPLLSDVYGSMQAWYDYQQGKSPIVRVTGNVNSRGGAVVKGLSGSTRIVDSTVYEARCHVVYEYVMTNPMNHTFSSIGLTNPLSLAWEVLPFSFVVDWFVPVGNTISALDAEYGMTFRRGIASTVLDMRVDRVGTYSSSSGSSSINPGNGYVSSASRFQSVYGHCSIRRLNYSRRILNQALGLRFPTLKNPFSVSHAASAIALLQQSFRR